MEPVRANNDGSYGADAFGLRWRSDRPLHLFTEAHWADETLPDVRVSRRAGLPAVRVDGRKINNGELFADGVRFTTPQGIVLDLWNGERIEWHERGGDDLPVPYPVFSTVTALLLAWRGRVPLHASAVAIDGRGLVICGPAGAGKSSLAAALVSAGARLISDDLTVLAADVPGAPRLKCGRPGVRLHPGVATMLGFRRGEPDIGDKLVVRPPGVSAGASIAPAAVLLLGTDEVPTIRLRGAALIGQLFRPAWMRNLPKRHWREAVLHQLAHEIPMMAAPALDTSSADALHRMAGQVADRFLSGRA